MLAAMVLGAEGVQIGTRFIATRESSAHPLFKQRIVEARDGDTFLSLKQLVPVRLLKNKFFETLLKMEEEGASAEALSTYLGHGRAKTGMFEGSLDEGELEAGQIAALIREVKPVRELMEDLLSEFREGLKGICLID